MHRRFTILFLLMVAVPLVLLVWLSFMMAKNDAEDVRERWLEGLNQQLGLVDNWLLQEMNRLGGEFDGLLQNTALEESVLRSLPRDQPLIRHAFLLDQRSRLVFPKPGSTAQGESQAFLRRTEPVWESGVKFGEEGAQVIVSNTYSNLALDNVSPNSGISVNRGSLTVGSNDIVQGSNRSSATYVRSKDGRPQVQAEYNKNAAAFAQSGWHIWFYGNGPQMLYWQQREDGRVVGVEVEMAALLSLLVNRLGTAPVTQPQNFWLLRDVDGKTVLHQWGIRPGSDLARFTPAVRRTCAAPLGMWQLEVYPGPQSVPRSNTLSVWLAATAAGMALLALSWLLYREGTREMREARRRVTFVNQVSHELKTQLTNIRLYAEMAQHQAEAAGEEGVVRHLAVVEAETSRLGRLIHNVLTFASHQRDQLVVHPKPGVLDELVARTMDLWRPGLEAKGFEVIADLGAPARFPFDPDAMEQVLGNLLSNVEKYAASGAWVRVFTAMDQSAVRLRVEDHGPGVPAAKCEAVFQPFVRLRHDLAEGVSGTGIGLAISRELVQLQSGTLILEETGQPGSSFLVTLPLTQP
ncbi:MAG TPA: HAMP domain-containing sensor histidine kinase [Verrucomicrobium sp.]|nr:HAMP domain-containing sensor histidine kinase [Verrucomicrobium sp.]